MEEKYKKQSIERFEFISEDNLNKLKQENINSLGELSTKKIVYKRRIIIVWK